MKPTPSLLEVMTFNANTCDLPLTVIPARLVRFDAILLNSFTCSEKSGACCIHGMGNISDANLSVHNGFVRQFRPGTEGNNGFLLGDNVAGRSAGSP